MSDPDGWPYGPITIIGAGAIGGTVGAFLTEAGYDVTLVDVVREHVDVMNSDGLGSAASGETGDIRSRRSTQMT
ncbi:MAG: 2-dehydropantoate 2-reductase N-terminal domain-containing protein [Thermomicrobiales bacterium]